MASFPILALLYARQWKKWARKVAEKWVRGFFFITYNLRDNLREQCLLRIVSVKKVSVKNNEFIRSPYRWFVSSGEQNVDPCHWKRTAVIEVFSLISIRPKRYTKELLKRCRVHWNLFLITMRRKNCVARPQRKISITWHIFLIAL